MGGGVVGGGGGGIVGFGGPVGAAWSPSTDQHAIGESRCFSLIRITNDTSEFCLGCIGSDECWFCRSTACNTVSHKKRRYELACQEGFYIPTEGQFAMRPQCAFRSPFIDAARMTPEVQHVVTATGDEGIKTMHEWEEFILAASMSWHVFQESQSRGVWEI